MPSTQVQQVAAAQWSADTVHVPLGGGAVQVAAADPNRASLTIINDIDSAGALWLVPNPGQTRGGVRLVPGAGYEFHHGSPVYGYAVTGDCDAYAVNETGAVC